MLTFDENSLAYRCFCCCCACCHVKIACGIFCILEIANGIFCIFKGGFAMGDSAGNQGSGIVVAAITTLFVLLPILLMVAAVLAILGILLTRHVLVWPHIIVQILVIIAQIVAIVLVILYIAGVTNAIGPMLNLPHIGQHKDLRHYSTEERRQMKTGTKIMIYVFSFLYFACILMLLVWFLKLFLRLIRYLQDKRMFLNAGGVQLA